MTQPAPRQASHADQVPAAGRATTERRLACWNGVMDDDGALSPAGQKADRRQ
jgi:hypothetical protein